MLKCPGCRPQTIFLYLHLFQFSSVQSLSRVRLFATPWIAACQASQSITNSQSLLKLMSIKSVMPSSHLILCRPLLLLPPIPPSIRVFSSESTVRMRWPKYWSFSLSIIPSSEHPGLISFRLDWLFGLFQSHHLVSCLEKPAIHCRFPSLHLYSRLPALDLSPPYLNASQCFHMDISQTPHTSDVLSLLSFSPVLPIVITIPDVGNYPSLCSGQKPSPLSLLFLSPTCTSSAKLAVLL